MVFMPIKVKEEIFKLEVKLPDLKIARLNSYLLLDEVPTLIDLGSNSYGAIESLMEELNVLGFMFSEVKRIIITHYHIDHSGLLHLVNLINPNAEIFISEADFEIIKNMEERYKELDYLFSINGAPSELIKKALSKEIEGRIRVFKKASGLKVNLIKGDEKVGKLNLVLTPGHTPGHVCVYSESKRVLFSGDHLLWDITPNVSYYNGNSDPLGDYIASLKKVKELKVDAVLPAHRGIYVEHEKRIEELIEHHKERLSEIVEMLRGRNLTAYEIARGVKWRSGSFDELDDFQKRLALGETISHIIYLERRGVLSRKTVSGIIYYTLNEELGKRCNGELI
jgi:glyoxylase-like metal-dependent hydrolase (beta-lactamase superfamily II)